MNGEQVAARTAQAARVERLAVSLVRKCLAFGVSAEEAALGLVGAAVSLAAAGNHRQGGIEWCRTALDRIERDHLKAPTLPKAGG